MSEPCHVIRCARIGHCAVLKRTKRGHGVGFATLYCLTHARKLACEMNANYDNPATHLPWQVYNVIEQCWLDEATY